MSAALDLRALEPELEPLLPGAVAGDRRSQAELLAAIQPFVLRYCRARLGRQETGMGSADDVAQDVCLAVVRALPGYKLKGRSFKAFVYGIAAHKVADAFRVHGRNRMEPVAELPEVAVVTGGPEQHVIDAELADVVCRLLDVLSPRQREVLILRIVVGLSAEETAELVGSTPGAVRVTQHRAIIKLRDAAGGSR